MKKKRSKLGENLVSRYINLPYRMRKRTDPIVRRTVRGAAKTDSYMQKSSARGEKEMKKRIKDILRRLDKK